MIVAFTAADVGAVTWGNGTSGRTGVVSASNSLVGSTQSDNVGGNGVTALTNGNYVVASANWDSSATNTDFGAVTWGNGTSGRTGVVSASNSLVGSTVSDGVGSAGVTALTNGNYVVRSSAWDSGATVDVGAVTWGNGATNGTSGRTGVVSASNSLVGSTAFDNVGGSGLTELTNGNYVVRSSNWDSGTITNVGAVTWGNGTSGISGVVSSSNSIVGQTANIGGSWSITTASNLDAFLASNPSDGSGRVVLGSSARGFSLPSTPAGSLQAANGSVSLSVAGTNLQGTISSNANVTIAPSQTARQIDLGSKPSGKLGLTDTELDGIAAANLRIGSPTSGDLSISSPISRPTSTAMQLTSGGAILFGSGAQSANGAINTAGGTLGLDAGSTIKPVTPGVDANTSALSFAAGETLQMDITGATVDSQYSQLSVVGPVTLTGVTLSLNVNFPAMIGTETFTIVNATGGVTGQFSGLIQEGAISVGSFAYTVNYTANSVQLVPSSAGIAPAITQSPSNQTVVTGNTATFTAAASGSPTPTVQWQVSTNGGTSWSNISGATSTTYSFTAVSGDNGKQYRAVFTNTAGSATSSAATLTVNYAPSVTQNPSSSTVSSGATASFTAAATGNPTPTVQWQISTNGGTSWSDIYHLQLHGCFR
ncbi:MAG: immunoglobulin domain-containing protein [Planctomycetota bacterium]|nr:immunoglobulin domain-containing protein [Planctomycetota bacterium]